MQWIGRACAVLAVVGLLAACNTVPGTQLTMLESRQKEPASVRWNVDAIRFTSGGEYLVNFSRMKENGKLAFCVFAVSSESPGPATRLWFENARIYLGEIPIASGRMIPFHTLGPNNSYVARCAATDYAHDDFPAHPFSVRGTAVTAID